MRKNELNPKGLRLIRRKLRQKTKLKQTKRIKSTRKAKQDYNSEQHMQQSSRSPKYSSKGAKKNTNPVQKIKRLRKRRPCRLTCKDHQFILRKINNSEESQQNENQINPADQIQVNFCMSKNFTINQLPVIPGQKLRKNHNLPFFLGQVDVWNRSYLNTISKGISQQNLFVPQQFQDDQICIRERPPLPTIDGELKCHHCNQMLYSKMDYIKHLKSQEHQRNWNNSEVLQEIKKIIKDINSSNKRKIWKKPTKTKKMRVYTLKKRRKLLKSLNRQSKVQNLPMKRKSKRQQKAKR